MEKKFAVANPMDVVCNRTGWTGCSPGFLRTYHSWDQIHDSTSAGRHLGIPEVGSPPGLARRVPAFMTLILPPAIHRNQSDWCIIEG